MSFERRPIKEFEETGYWWLPSNPSNRISGTLKCSDKGKLTLELMGSFVDSPGWPQIDDYALVIGWLRDGPVSLLNCKLTTRDSLYMQEDSPLTESQHYVQTGEVKVGLFGVGFEKDEEKRFHKVLINYNYLPDWLKIPWIDRSSPKGRRKTQKAKNKDRQYIYTYEPPQKLEVITAKGITISIEHGISSGPTLDNSQYDFGIKRHVYLEVDLPEEHEIDYWLSEIIFPLQNFISLATNTRNTVISATVFSEHLKGPFLSSKIIELPIEVVFEIDYPDVTSRFPLLDGNMLFSFKDIEQDFGPLIEKWLEFFSLYSVVCKLYFEVIYNSRMVLEQRFLNIAQALETFHGSNAKFTTEALPKEEHEKRKSFFVEKSPPEWEAWIKGKLERNDPPLRQRLKELCEYAQEVMVPLVGDINAFVGKVVKKRNGFAHPLSQSVSEAKELEILTRNLIILLQACFLRELGFAPDKCTEIFNRYQTYAREMGFW